jgi:hypothetical protein
MRSEELQDREVHPGIHQPERIPGRGDAVEVRDRREVPALNYDAGAAPGVPCELFGCLLALAGDGQAFERHG